MARAERHRGRVARDQRSLGQPGRVRGGIRGNLVALSVATGATLWTAPGTSAGYYASPAVSRGRVFDVDLSGKITAYALP